MFDPERSPIPFDRPDRTAFPLIVPWPTRGNIGGMLEFREASEWLAFLQQRDLRTRFQPNDRLLAFLEALWEANYAEWISEDVRTSH
jgi:hypothetical protein